MAAKTKTEKRLDALEKIVGLAMLVLSKMILKTGSRQLNEKMNEVLEELKKVNK